MKRRSIKNYLMLLCILCILDVSSQTTPPPEINITYPSQIIDVKLYELFEAQFNLNYFTYENQFDPSEIEVTGYFTSPNGTLFKLPGFYYHDITKSDPGGNNDLEILTIQSTYNWRLRFTPNEVGSWEYYIVAIDQNKTTVQTVSRYFNCTTGDGKGFIRKADERYLKYDDGSQYFPVGTNLPRFDRFGYWSQQEYGTNSMKEYIDNMNDASINHFRLEINFFQGINLYGIDLTDGKNYYKYFNPKDSWQLDETISYAASKGITISLAINSWQDMCDLSYAHYAWRDFNPYNQNVVNTDFYYSNDHVGNCIESWDILTDSEAIKVQKNLMRYIIARWGYATNVSSLIVWDEANQIAVYSINPPPPELPQLVYDWHIPMIEYIKHIDPYNHMVNSGNAGNEFFKDTDAIEDFDFYQGHMHRNMENNFDMDYDKLLFDAVEDNYTRTSLPALVGEFSYFKNDGMVAHDPKGYGFHSVFWSSLFNGSFGTPMHWALSFLQDLFPDAIDRYNGVGNFAPSLPTLSDNLSPHWDNDNSDFRVCYLSNNNSTKFYGWMQDENFRLGNILSDPYLKEYLIDFSTHRPTPNQNEKIKFSVTKSGDYIVKWYETTDGVLFNEAVISINDPLTEQLEIQLPSDLHDGVFADGTFIVQYDCENKWNNSLVNGSSAANVRGNSNIISDSYGQPLFIGTDDDVRIMWFNGTYYQNVPLLANTTYNVRSNTGLAIDNINRVYYIAEEDNKIHRLFWNWETKQWEEEVIAQSLLYNVRPNSSLCISDLYSIYYVNNDDDKVHAFWLNEGNYTDVVLLPSADEVDITSLLSSDHKGYLYYMGMKDKKMHKLFWNWETKQWEELILDENFNTDISPFSPIRVNSSSKRIYYIGNDNKIHEKREVNPGQYVDATIAINNDYIVQNNSGLEFDSENKLYFTSDKLIHRTYWDISLGTWVIDELGFNFPENVNEYLCINNSDHIFYKGDDSRIYADYFGCDDNYLNSISKGIKKSSKVSAFNVSDNILTNEIETQLEKSVNIFPNPTTQIVNVRFANLSGQKSVIVLSVQGVQVAKSITFDNSVTIEVNDLNPGIYIVLIENNGNHIHKKIIIE